MKLPDKITEYIKDVEYHLDTVGQSNSQVLIFKKYVCKIQENNCEAKNERRLLSILKDTHMFPRIIDYTCKYNTAYLLMEKINIPMLSGNSFDEFYLKYFNAFKNLRLLDSLKIVEDASTERLLKVAEYNVRNNLVDLENVEPTTFSENNFKKPEYLLNHLKNNVPEPINGFVHGDFTPQNILTNHTDIKFIDIGRSGYGDIYRDIALMYRSLSRHTAFDHNKFIKDMEDIIKSEVNYENIKYYILIDELF